MTFRERVLRREALIGTHLTMNDFVTADILSLCDYDYIWIDTEHSFIDYSELLKCVRIIRSRGVAAVVRTQMNDVNHTKRLLDIGVDGIVFPQIDTPKEAMAAISSCLYPPQGTRGFGPHAAIDYGMRGGFDYARAANDEIAIFLQVESVKAVENLDKTCRLDHADGFIIGPCDLSGSLGCIADIKNEAVLAEVKKIVETLNANNKTIGISIAATEPDEQKFWIDRGINMISAGVDTDFIRKCAVENARSLRKITNSRKDG